MAKPRGSSFRNVRPAVTSWTIATRRHTPKNSTATHPAHAPDRAAQMPTATRPRHARTSQSARTLLALNSAGGSTGHHYPRRDAPYARGRGAEARGAALAATAARLSASMPISAARSVRSSSQSISSAANVLVLALPQYEPNRRPDSVPECNVRRALLALEPGGLLPALAWGPLRAYSWGSSGSCGGAGSGCSGSCGGVSTGSLLSR